MSRVLHLIDSAGLYGAERVVLALLGALKSSEFPGVLGCIRAGHAPAPAIAAAARLRGLEVRDILVPAGFRPSGPLVLRRAVQRAGVELVHSHGYKPDVWCGLQLRRQVPFLATVHGWSKAQAGWRNRLYETLDARALRRADRVVAVSEGVRRDLASRGVVGNVAVVHNGIDPPKCVGTERAATFRRRFAIPPGAPVIGAVGRLHPIKGFDVMIRALPQIIAGIPACRLCIAGDGPEREALAGLAQTTGHSERVILTGYLEDVPGFLSALNVYVMPSFSEGLPLSLLEAMAQGLPVVASRVGGIPEAVTGGVDGMLVPPGDSAALTQAVLGLLAAPRLAETLGLAAAGTVQRRFSVAAMAERYLQVYRGLVVGRSGVSA